MSIRLGQVEVKHTFLVVKSREVNLFGRDLCAIFDVKLCFPSDIKNLKGGHSAILDKYSDYLSENFKSRITDTVSLKLSSENCKPIFSKCRSVPIKMKPLVSDELNRLSDAGIITKVYTI